MTLQPDQEPDGSPCPRRHHELELRDVFDDEQVTEMRGAIEVADQADRDEVRKAAERFE